MQSVVLEIADEAVVLIPESVMMALGLAIDDKVDLHVEDGSVIISIAPFGASTLAERPHRIPTENDD